MKERNGVEIGTNRREDVSTRSIRGFWSFPGSDTYQVPGTLIIEPSGRMELALEGGGVDVDFMNSQTARTVHGEGDRGQKVTLPEVYCTNTETSISSTQSSPGTSPIKRQTWVSFEALIGRTFFDPREARVTFLSISTQKLHEWIGHLPFDFDNSDRRFAVSVELPPRATFEVLGASGTVGWREGGHSATAYRWIVEINSDITLELSESVTLEEAWSQWVSPIVQFILICHGENDRIESLNISTDKKEELASDITVPQTFEWINASWRGLASPSRAAYTGQHLLPYELVTSKINELIPRWFDLYRAAKYPIMQHLAPQLTDAEPFMEEKFATRVRSLESFHRDIHAGEYMDSSEFSAIVDEVAESYYDQWVDAGRQRLGQFFRDRLKHANEYSLKKRLDLLLEDSGDLLASDPESWRNAHRRIVATRDSLTHRSQFGEDLTHEEIAYVLSYLDELFSASVLRALGFDRREVDKALNRRSSRSFRIPGHVKF